MVRLEELPSTSEQVAGPEVNDLPSNPEGDADLDDLYDRAAASGGFTDKTFEEALSGLSQTPLFMTSLDDAGTEDNVALEALRALQYEGPKSEAAQNFKEQGNECVQQKKWSDAREYYHKGIAVIQDKDQERWEKPKDIAQEKAKCLLLSEQLHINRARCNLEMKNYRSTILDCGAALKLNPSNVKAHFRSASALFALDKTYEALDVCYRGLKLDPTNGPMETLLEKIRKRSRVKEEQDRKRRAEQDRQRQEKLVLMTALKARNIRLNKKSKPVDMAGARIKMVPDPLSPTSTLEFPAMFLYPMHNQSDFIQAFAEQDSPHQHLGYILPLPWDTRSEYKLNRVDCYMDTISGGMIKIGKKLSLFEILSNDKVEVMDGLVRIHVVPQSLAPKWIEEIKKKRQQ